MIREIIHDPIILKIKSKDANVDDIQIAKDLVETLEHHKDGCVGMAANMIGVSKRIIAFYDDKKIVTMFNPEITAKNQPYETKEGCLSLLGEPRPVTRYKSIKVRYQDKFMKFHEKRYSGFTAQIIQHEIDHCNGVLI
ncbi:MAG: peptide deformylase [Oscillospiraceae bacterium]|nr:peptide deformylase [Oscillospiraceae bacterium]